MNKTIAVVSGSLEAKSIHNIIIERLKQVGSVTIHQIDITHFPLFDQDLEESNLPQAVIQGKRIVKQSDAVILTVPNHNGKISAALKNAYDWLSRPQADNKSVMGGKIVGFITVSDTDNHSLIEHLKHMTQYCKCRLFLDEVPQYKKSENPKIESIKHFVQKFKNFISKH